jgi:adenylate cyclase
MTTTRRLAAILAADVAGYSAAMERDEEGTVAAVRALRRNVIEPKLAEHQGRLIKTTGDGFLAEFASPIAALKCALAIQRRPVDSDGLRLRIGLNLGDVIIEEGGDLLGEGVNVAARLEGLAEPGGILISDKVIREVEGKVDAAFDDRGEQQVKNITRPVRAYAVRLAGSPEQISAATLLDVGKPLPLPDMPSIAVLPFQNMSGDPEQEYFADGMVEDIITALSRFKSLFVIARNSSFTYKGRSVDIKQVGRELGVRYVLEGSVRRAGGQVRITGQLIEASTGAHLWADKYDGAIEDVFDLQDNVTEQVVGRITYKVRDAEIARSRRKPTGNLDAYDLYLRSSATWRTADRDSNDAALRLAMKAIELDPEYSSAYARAASFYTSRKQSGWMVDVEAETSEARRLALLGVRYGKDDEYALACAAMVLGYNCGEIETGLSLIDQAIALNSNSVYVWNYSGWLRTFAGDHAVAGDHFARALRIDPLDEIAVNLMIGISFSSFFRGKHAEAMNWANRALIQAPRFLPAHRIIAACCALTGRSEEAAKAAATIMSLDPAFRVSNPLALLPLRRDEDDRQFRGGLRLAGLPE